MPGMGGMGRSFGRLGLLSGGGGRARSYAMTELLKLGTSGIFASYEHDSVAIIDPVTPANNYDGNFLGAFSLVGTPVAGPNGGLASASSTQTARIAVEDFPWNPAAGAIGAEFIRNTDAGANMVYAHVGSTSVPGAGIRNGATISNTRLSVSGIGDFNGTPTTILGARHRMACSWSAAGRSLVLDENAPQTTTGGTCNLATTGLYLWFGGAGDKEVFEVWYVPG